MPLSLAYHIILLGNIFSAVLLGYVFSAAAGRREGGIREASEVETVDDVKKAFFRYKYFLHF